MFGKFHLDFILTFFCKEKAPVNKETQREQLLNPESDVEDIPYSLTLFLQIAAPPLANPLHPNSTCFPRKPIDTYT